MKKLIVAFIGWLVFFSTLGYSLPMHILLGIVLLLAIAIAWPTHKMTPGEAIEREYELARLARDSNHG